MLHFPSTTDEYASVTKVRDILESKIESLLTENNRVKMVFPCVFSAGTTARTVGIGFVVRHPHVTRVGQRPPPSTLYGYPITYVDALVRPCVHPGDPLRKMKTEGQGDQRNGTGTIGAFAHRENNRHLFIVTAAHVLLDRAEVKLVENIAKMKTHEDDEALALSSRLCTSLKTSREMRTVLRGFPLSRSAHETSLGIADTELACSLCEPYVDCYDVGIVAMNSRDNLSDMGKLSMDVLNDSRESGVQEPTCDQTISGAMDVNNGDIVYKCGITTGWTEGRVITRKLFLRVCNPSAKWMVIPNQIFVQPLNPKEKFCDSGDSGSLPWHPDEPQTRHTISASGILHTLVIDASGHGFGVATAATAVEKRFDVKFSFL